MRGFLKYPSTWRRWTQAAVFAVFIYVIWNTRYPLTHAAHPVLIFQMDPLVMLVTAVAERLWLPGLTLAFLTLAVTLVFGRVFCGWLCPLGASLDFAGWVKSHWSKPREKEPGPGLRSKYMLFGLIFLAALAGWQWAWFFDPLAIFVRAFSLNLHPALNQATDRAFAWILEATHDYPPLETLYYQLQDRFLDLGQMSFPHSGAVLLVFGLVLGSVLVKRRWWCRYVCPLGACLGLVAKFSWYRRRAAACPGACSHCRQVCRTNAIRSGNEYLPSECILCFDCVDQCPGDQARFAFEPPFRTQRPDAAPARQGMTRAEFLAWLSGSMLWLAGSRARFRPAAAAAARPVLRPPGSRPENEFIQRCIRCGNCMKVCLTHVLQPAVAESGWGGIWTPKLSPELAYCEYRCNLCGQVCPTGAIQPLTMARKLKTKIGLAVIDRELCLPWSSGGECLVCEEHCPVSRKAIKTLPGWPATPSARRPWVNPKLCVGCSICENKCPVRPRRAIRVRPL